MMNASPHVGLDFLFFYIVVECKVCGDLMNDKSIFCQVCALICHEECKKSAFSCPPKVNDQQASYDVSANHVFPIKPLG